MASQIFMHLLNQLQHAGETCYAEVAGPPGSGTPGPIVYGGNCAQAFIVTLFDRFLTFVMP